VGLALHLFWEQHMPPNHEDLNDVVRLRTYLFSSHASKRAAERLILSHEIEEAILSGEVIEDYPADKYGPSCLILGYTHEKRALHIQVSYPPNVKIITVYEPSPNDWETDLKTRKTP
jgi:hypothetical protein